MGEEVELLEDHPDLATELERLSPLLFGTWRRAVLGAEDPQRPGVGLFEQVDRPQQGRFPRPRRAENDDVLAGVNVEVDPLQDLDGPEPFADAPELDDDPASRGRPARRQAVRRQAVRHHVARHHVASTPCRLAPCRSTPDRSPMSRRRPRRQRPVPPARSLRSRPGKRARHTTRERVHHVDDDIRREARPQPRAQDEPSLSAERPQP